MENNQEVGEQQTAVTPKEKAQDLCRKMFDSQYSEPCSWLEARQCALIALEEIINAIDWHEFEVPNDELNYWIEVKQEIKKL